MIRKVLTSDGWKALGSILPGAPDPSDPRGETKHFHGRYRGPHNTGIPDKSALALPEFGFTAATPNVTYSDRYFIGTVDVTATGVVFERCYFETKVGDIYTFTGTVATTLIDCELSGGKEGSNAVILTGKVHAIRCHIHGGGNDSVGFDDGATFEDCYIHSPYDHFGSHSDIAQTLTADAIALLRCKLLGYNPYTGIAQNAVIQLGGTVHGMEITDNYIDGGGYAVNANINTPNVTGVFFRGNRFGRHSAFGPISLVAPPGTADDSNVFDDTGVSVI